MSVDATVIAHEALRQLQSAGVERVMALSEKVTETFTPASTAEDVANALVEPIARLKERALRLGAIFVGVSPRDGARRLEAQEDVAVMDPASGVGVVCRRLAGDHGYTLIAHVGVLRREHRTDPARAQATADAIAVLRMAVRALDGTQ